MVPYFIATERFGPSHEGWAGYVAWSGLSQVTDLISLDGLLCKAAIDVPSEDDWRFVAGDVQEFLLFTDLEHLVQRTRGREDLNLLCVFKKPDSEPGSGEVPAGFRFVGYDLIETEGSVSALCNCGGFPAVFVPSDLSPHGLLTSLPRALQIQQDLRRLYPEEPHALCDVWAIFILRADNTPAAE